MHGGLRAGVLCVLLSTVATDYFFIFPSYSFWIDNPNERISLFIFIVVGIGIALLSESQRRALQRADQEALLRRGAELEERTQRRRFETTLASIGDGVIATTADGNVSFMNIAAETITGWTQEEALGTQIETVFQIIDQDNRKPVENPGRRAIREGDITWSPLQADFWFL